MAVISENHSATAETNALEQVMIFCFYILFLSRRSRKHRGIHCASQFKQSQLAIFQSLAICIYYDKTCRNTSNHPDLHGKFFCYV